MFNIRGLVLLCLFSLESLCLAQRIEVTVPATAPLHGHLILVIAKHGSPEPRMQM